MAESFNKQFGGTAADFSTKTQMHAAKPSRYPAGGCGRDSYIETNNGGLYKAQQPGSAATVGSLRTNVQIS